MAIAPALNAQSAQGKPRGTALTRQAVLTTAPTGAEPIVQAARARCAAKKAFPTALQKNPARKRAAIGAFHKPRTTAGVQLPAQPATRTRRGTVTLNRSALGQTHNGALPQRLQAMPAILPTAPTRARHAQLKLPGIAATRTHASQTARTGAEITAPLPRARFALLARSGTVTRSRPARRPAATGATLIALQVHARFARAKARGVVITRNHALMQARNGAEPTAPPIAPRAAMIPRGIVPQKKPALALAATGAALIVPARFAHSAQNKTRGHAVTKNHALQ